ncbi:glycoside hydrolase family 3 N-terminal domain-containing protein [Cytobacillus gottheilii]|uniref:beta-N-acetylhexosaminidase n=1 Tax=Cytobacillus gottheilii TaxID=859144 RepID=A0ABX8FE35_9BACI|nr:glycoside hydrolase family 3 N-terminal domain-containing protein [Cytobacillus gottheilii]QVY62142.1 glycoside hydrolase family 3 C-terminal domain-containing protein [Cytobacillus gottheilii]
MKNFLKNGLVGILTILLLASMALPAGVQAAKSKTKDLILLENVPDLDRQPADGYKLTVLNVYNDGQFKTVNNETLKWKSSNKNVATVSSDGEITFTGKKGNTFITVSAGKDRDRIAIQFKGNHKSKEPFFKKEKGKQYDVIAKSINSMTIEEKVGQMLMPDFRTWDGENVTEMLPEIEQLVKDYHLGGVILFRENVVTTEQTARLVSAYEEASEKYGLLMTIDQEGGIVTRLQSGTDMPGNMALGATRSAEVAEKVGHAIGEELNALGFNMNFAPVLDVNNNPDNPVIGVRSFGEDPELVAEMGVAYTKGMQASGVAATAKHFPGHGDTAVDSHLGLPEVPHDLERLKEVELYPFQKAMEAEIDAIMTAHVTFPNIDDTKVISQKTGEEISLPATLSHKVLTELMRDEMGYEGVITTDAMNMKAIADHFGPVDAAIRAVKAGTDIVLMPVGLQEVAEGLVEAVKTGEISENRIEASVQRILKLKLDRGVIKQENPHSIEDKIANAVQVVGSEEHKQIEKEAAQQSITLVKNDNNALPLHAYENQKIAVVGSSYIGELGDAIKKHHQNTEVITAASNFVLTDEQKETIAKADAVIIGSHTSNVAGRAYDHPQMKMIRDISAQTEAPVIAVGIRNPYDIMSFNEVDAYIAQYGFRTASFQASAAAIFGEINPSGQLPVTIPDLDGNTLYEFGHGLNY